MSFDHYSINSIKSAIMLIVLGLVIIFGFGFGEKVGIALFFTVLAGFTVSSIGALMLWRVFQENKNE
jgi:uncharacterized membrane protein YjjP (DUF1212 family)